MIRLFDRFTFPAILVFVIAGINVSGLALYSGLELDEPPLLSLLRTVGWLWAIGWWLTDDLSRRRERWIYCPGLFLAQAWPFVLPYYLLKTRGPRALITITVFVALSIAATVTGAVVGTILTQVSY